MLNPLPMSAPPWAGSHRDQSHFLPNPGFLAASPNRAVRTLSTGCVQTDATECLLVGTGADHPWDLTSRTLGIHREGLRPEPHMDLGLFRSLCSSPPQSSVCFILNGKSDRLWLDFLTSPHEVPGLSDTGPLCSHEIANIRNSPLTGVLGTRKWHM